VLSLSLSFSFSSTRPFYLWCRCSLTTHRKPSPPIGPATPFFSNLSCPCSSFGSFGSPGPSASHPAPSVFPSPPSCHLLLSQAPFWNNSLRASADRRTCSASGPTVFDPTAASPSYNCCLIAAAGHVCFVFGNFVFGS
jgi:hypothetical protein